MFFMKAFFGRIINDFRQKELLPLKLLFFVHASTLFVLYPYLTIHMRELGINVEETAIMSAVTPIVAIVMPPLAGMVADKIGNFRILLAIFSTLGGAASLLLLLVPVGRVTVTYPDRVIMDVGCNVPQDSFLELSLSSNQSCSVLPSLTHQVDIRLESCGFVCQDGIGGQISPVALDHLDLNTSHHILATHSYDVIITNSYPGNVTDTYSYTVTSEHTSTSNSDVDLKRSRVMKNNEFYSTTVRNTAEGWYFFPTTGLYNMSCGFENDTLSYKCHFGHNGTVGEGTSKIHPTRQRFKMTLVPVISSDDNSTHIAFQATWLHNMSAKKEHFNATCNDIYEQNGQSVSISVPLGRPESHVVQLTKCMPRCLMTAPRKQLCSDLKREEVYDISLTFWSYLVIRVFIGMIGGTAFAMFEGAVIAILREQNADYGLQRIYATIGGMISSPLSGLLIDYASRGKGYTDFRPAFYLYAGLKIASGALMLSINLEFKAPATNVVHDVVSVLKNIEIVALFIAIFILGTAWGYIESFLFWLLQDLGGSRSLMGITITVGGIAGIPLLVLSGPIIDRIGHANVLFIGFIFYAIRLLGYSLIYNPWLCLIFEAMESVTSSLSFTAAVTYAAKLSTTTTDSSIQGLLGGLYFGVGKGAGSLIGGYMMTAFGTRETYRIFSVSCAVTGLLYFLFNKFYLLKRPQVEGNDIVKKKPQQNQNKVIEIDMNACEKEKETNVNNTTETIPINKNTSKLYTSDSKHKTNEDQPNNCNINIGYLSSDDEGAKTDKQTESSAADSESEVRHRNASST